MRATLEQVDSFREYARQQLANGESQLTIDELYDRWRGTLGSDTDLLAVQASLKDMEQGETGRSFDDFDRETVRAIQQSRAEFAAGQSQSLDEADADIRRQLGFAPRP
jgi:hypothetical protein